MLSDAALLDSPARLFGYAAEIAVKRRSRSSLERTFDSLIGKTQIAIAQPMKRHIAVPANPIITGTCVEERAQEVGLLHRIGCPHFDACYIMALGPGFDRFADERASRKKGEHTINCSNEKAFQSACVEAWKEVSVPKMGRTSSNPRIGLC